MQLKHEEIFLNLKFVEKALRGTIAKSGLSESGFPLLDIFFNFMVSFPLNLSDHLYSEQVCPEIDALLTSAQDPSAGHNKLRQNKGKSSVYMKRQLINEE